MLSLGHLLLRHCTLPIVSKGTQWGFCRVWLVVWGSTNFPAYHWSMPALQWDAAVKECSLPAVGLRVQPGWGVRCPPLRDLALSLSELLASSSKAKDQMLLPCSQNVNPQLVQTLQHLRKNCSLYVNLPLPKNQSDAELWYYFHLELSH